MRKRPPSREAIFDRIYDSIALSPGDKPAPTEEHLGHGYGGEVRGSTDPSIVIKITTDVPEIMFWKDHLAKPFEGVVPMRAIVPVSPKMAILYRTRVDFVGWSAIDKISDPYIARTMEAVHMYHDILDRIVWTLLDERTARQRGVLRRNVLKRLSVDRYAETILGALDIAKALRGDPVFGSIATGILEAWDRGWLLFDMKAANFGLYNGKLVIIDPSAAVKFP